MTKYDWAIVGILLFALILTGVGEWWSDLILITMAIILIFLPAKYDPAIRSKEKRDKDRNQNP